MIEIRVEDKKMYKKMWNKFMNDKVVKLCGVAYFVESGDRLYSDDGEMCWFFKLRRA